MKKVEFTEEVIKAAYDDIRAECYYNKAMEDYSDLDGDKVLSYLIYALGEDFQDFGFRDLAKAAKIFIDKDEYMAAVEKVYNLLIADITADFRAQFFDTLK